MFDIYTDKPNLFELYLNQLVFLVWHKDHAAHSAVFIFSTRGQHNVMALRYNEKKINIT